MTTKQLIISSFIRFKDLKEARNVPFWKAIVYLLVLSIIMLCQSLSSFSSLKQHSIDGQKIATRIPDFTIKTGSFKPKKKKDSFTKQTPLSSHLIQRENEQNRTSLLI